VLPLAAPPARAQQVDPRWRYAPELAAGFVLVTDVTGSLNAVGRSPGGVSWHLRPGFFAPVAESRLAGGGLSVNGLGQVALFGEYRVQQDFADPRVTTRTSAGPVAAVWPEFGLGARLGAGGALEFSPGWRAGIDAAIAATVIHFRVNLELAASLSYLF
jgi:hypothetical protein